MSPSWSTFSVVPLAGLLVEPFPPDSTGSAESRDCWKRGRYDQTSRPCTRSRMRPRPRRTSPGTCQGFMGCRPVGRERQDAGHTAKSCFVWPRHLQRVTYLLAYGWAYCKRAEGPSVSSSLRLKRETIGCDFGLIFVKR